MNKKIAIPIGVVLSLALVVASVLYAVVPAEITVSEALSTGTATCAIAGFPGETKTCDITLDNDASVSLNTSLVFTEDSNVNDVDYSTNLPMTVTLAPGANTITVSFDIAPDTAVGMFNGTVSATREA